MPRRNRVFMSGRVLVVDDQIAMTDLVRTVLSLEGHDVTTVNHADDALSAIDDADFDAVLTDVRMPGTDGIELCRRIGQLRPDLPVVVMTAFGSMETAVEALRADAYDFVTKPLENAVLVAAIRRAADHSRLTRQIRSLDDTAPPTEFPRLIGRSEPMRSLRRQLPPLAASDASLLITGESGTGKELVARSVHEASPRAGRPFVAVNCAALSDTLLESELFGHARGSFTDARADREGLFVAADGGTLLLDEMGDMPPAVQVKLLRVLEERRVRPVGSDREIDIDVRVMSATHRDLEAAVEDGSFRQDLYYRINVLSIDLPPLRSRGADILLLAEHFVDSIATRAGKAIAGITRPAAERLLAYHWPGNIRQLRNVIERAVALSTTDRIGVEDLPPAVVDHEPSRVWIGGDDPSELQPLSVIEDAYIRHVLRATGGHRTRAAEILGLDRKTLYRRLKE